MYRSIAIIKPTEFNITRLYIFLNPASPRCTAATGRAKSTGPAPPPHTHTRLPRGCPGAFKGKGPGGPEMGDTYKGACARPFGSRILTGACLYFLKGPPGFFDPLHGLAPYPPCMGLSAVEHFFGQRGQLPWKLAPPAGQRRRCDCTHTYTHTYIHIHIYRYMLQVKCVILHSFACISQAAGLSSFLVFNPASFLFR